MTRLGNQKHCRANADAPIYAEPSGIVRKTFGMTCLLQEALSGFSEETASAFVYGATEGPARRDRIFLIGGEEGIPEPREGGKLPSAA